MKQKHALIVGASGIVGAKLAQYLALHEEIKISGIARTSCPDLQKKMNLIVCDIMDKEKITELLQPIVKEITHVFYVTWIRAKNKEKEPEENLTMFKNVMEPLKEAPLQFVYLQTGTKYYGMHIGPEKGYKIPSREDSPRPSDPFFHYSLEDYLKEFHEKHSNGSWYYSVARPPIIIGNSQVSKMNFGVSLAIYASLLKELGQPLLYPGSVTSFTRIREFCDNGLLCQFILWMSCDPESRAGTYNLHNGDYVLMEQLWKRVAQYFGMEAKIADKPFSVIEFMKEHKHDWKKMVDKYGLEKLDLKHAGTWNEFEAMVGREWDELTVTTKVHQKGFTEYCNTFDVFDNLFDGLKRKNIIPCCDKEGHA